jgi:hypothetical protein
LFEKALAVFDEFLQAGDFAFTAARSALKQAQAQALFQYLLDNEERTNGREPNTDQVCITGLWVDSDLVSGSVGFDCSRMRIHQDSIATAVLAEKFGLSFFGLLRTTSSLYGKVWHK